MNFIDTLISVDLVLATGEVPLIVGETGVGKTALAKEVAQKNNWSFITIDGNLLKEGEIGGLPTIESYTTVNHLGNRVEKKATVYAVHTKLKQIDEEVARGATVLLFIDEINRCEHTVQQELMNLILNREINGYKLHQRVKIVAAMNPSGKYGADFDYQVVDMDVAQENRFVWLHMEPDYMQWVDWAIAANLEPKVIEFISTFPEYLHKVNADDIRATPRSYERISGIYRIYKEKNGLIPKSVFLNVIKGNVGKLIAEEFVAFVDADYSALISYDDVFSGNFLHESIVKKMKNESHTRLYLAAKNILQHLETSIQNDSVDTGSTVERLIVFLKLYPVDLMIGIMKDIKNSYPAVYELALENETFVEAYFESYRSIRRS